MNPATTALYSTWQAAIPALLAFQSLKPTCPQYLEVARGFALTEDGHIHYPSMIRLSVYSGAEGALRFQREVLRGSMDGVVTNGTDMDWAGFDAYCRWSGELAGYFWNINELLFTYPDYYTPVPNFRAILEAVENHERGGRDGHDSNHEHWVLPGQNHEHWTLPGQNHHANGDDGEAEEKDVVHFDDEDDNVAGDGVDWVCEGSAVANDREWVSQGWGCVEA